MDRADIQRAALARFAEKGYQGTSVRTLTTDLGVTPAAFYHHFVSKSELLASLIEDITNNDLRIFAWIRAEGRGSPLDGFIYSHVYTHCVGRDEALIVREAVSVENDHQDRMKATLRRYEQEFSDVISSEYLVDPEELGQLGRAVVGLGASVVGWYSPDGSHSAHDIAVDYIRYARGLLEAAERSFAEARGESPPERPIHKSDEAALHAIEDRILSQPAPWRTGNPVEIVG